jgi:hypothetical protein
MIASEMQVVANAVVRRAERQGYVVPRDIREEVGQAGLPDSSWKEVLELARPGLNYRHGRYYHLHTVSERSQEERSQQQAIYGVIRQIIQHHRRQARSHDRRNQERIEFVQPIRVEAEDGRVFNVLSRDLSPTGMRLISTRSFLGHKLRINVPTGVAGAFWTFAIRVLWTCAIGDNLYENGGVFLEVLPISGSGPSQELLASPPPR